MYSEIILAFLTSAILTLIFKWIIQKSGSSLYTSIRGGTPRAVGIAPFISLIIFINPPFSYLVVLIGIFALIDDIIGRRNLAYLPFEIGQLSRGIGMIVVAILGFFYFGPASIIIALMIQPLNISDMQPGSACSVVILMSAVVFVLMFLTGSTDLTFPLIILVSCIAYAPLDYSGEIMMGEVGNHSFAVALGVAYALLGGYLGIKWGLGSWLGSFLSVLTLFIFSSLLIAFIRRNNLKIFIQKNLEIEEPLFGDYVMDVITGGGLGDLFRRFILKNRVVKVKNKILIHLGFRRLFYNPYARLSHPYWAYNKDKYA